MPNTFIQDIRAKAAKKYLTVAFSDAEDVRTPGGFRLCHWREQATCWPP